MADSIYIFSGLGADERVFQKMDFSGLGVIFVKWIKPEKYETIENYTSRLLTQIKTEKPILIGLSFGGIIALETARQIATEKVILLASVKTKNEIPFYFRWAGFSGLHKLLPAGLLKSSNSFTNWLFGANAPEEKQLLKTILQETDSDFLKWAIDKIVKWQNLGNSGNIVHIHGTADRILPFRFVKCNDSIEGGGHFMTITHSSILTHKIREQL